MNDTLRALWPHLKPHRGRFAGAAAAMAVLAATSGAGVYLLKPIVDRIFVTRDPETLRLAVLAIPAVFLVKSVAAYVQNYLMSRIGQGVVQSLRLELFAHLHRLSLDFFWRNRAGEVLSRATNDLTQVESMLHFVPLYLCRDALTLVALGFVLLFLDWQFALLALAGLPPAALIIRGLGRKARDASVASQQLMGGLYQRFSESLHGMLVIKAFQYERGAVERFDADNRRFFREAMRYLRVAAVSGPLMELLAGLVMAAVLYFAGGRIVEGSLTPGAFFAFVGCFMAAYAPTKNIAKSNAELQRGLAAAGRVLELLAEKPSVPETRGGLACRGVEGDLELRGVRYRYPGRETWALRGLDLRIRRGEAVGLVGPSGSGKSTVVYLLLRLLDPLEGEVRLDGRGLAEYDTAGVRAMIGLVTQETILFHDSIAANVALGRPDAPRPDVEAACRLADADAFIRELPDGYETVVGDRGVRLSGGQRQRLAIARALLKDPAVLILDEATSNLDSASEAAVQRAIEAAAKGRTVVQIAHRLSTVQGADRIHVLSDGAVVESGTHGELLSGDGLYAKLWRMQAQSAPVEEALG